MTDPFFVDLGPRSYPVHVDSGLLARAGALVSHHVAGGRIAVVSDATTAELYAEALIESLREEGLTASLVLVPVGEAAKTLFRYAELQRELLSEKIGRDGAIVALGGGCVGDLAGFAAATLYRGVRLIHAPTTLLAQVDSSIGGKTGINAPHGKNLIGSFHQPECVLADVDVLRSLPSTELRAGYAELYKAGLLGDRSLVRWLENHGESLLEGGRFARITGIRRAIQIKAGIVAGDEREAGDRALLNLGHTFAHALEAAEGQTGALPHGFAVSVGLALAAEVSVRMDLCRANLAEEVRGHLAARGLPTRPGSLPGAPFDPARLLEFMAYDKKSRLGHVALILFREIGRAFVCSDPAWDVVERVLVDACAG